MIAWSALHQTYKEITVGNNVPNSVQQYCRLSLQQATVCLSFNSFQPIYTSPGYKTNCLISFYDVKWFNLEKVPCNKCINEGRMISKMHEYWLSRGNLSWCNSQWENKFFAFSLKFQHSKWISITHIQALQNLFTLRALFMISACKRSLIKGFTL